MIILIMGVCGSGKTTIGKALAERVGWVFADADDFHPLSNVAKMERGQPLTDEDRWPWLHTIHDYMERSLREKRSVVMTCSALKKSYRRVLLEGLVSPVLVKSDDTSGCDKTISDIPAELDNRKAYCNTECDVNVDPNSAESRKDNLLNHMLESPGSVCSRGDVDVGSVRLVYLRGSREMLEERLRGRVDHFMPPSLLTSQLNDLEEPPKQENVLTVNIEKSLNEIVNDIISNVINLS